MGTTRKFFAAVCVMFGIASPASAAPPGNDARTSPRDLGSLPTRVAGTTVDATDETTDPIVSCASAKGSVWYRLRTRAAARVVLRLQNDGDLDGTIDVFKRTRSQLDFVDCQRSDRKGAAQLGFNVKADEDYLIRVAQLSNSVPGTFTLDAGAVEPAARFPGTRLSGPEPDGVDAVLNPSDAWNALLRAGVTYRVNLVSLPAADDEPDASPPCLELTVYGPDAESFDDDPFKHRGCGGYLAFTPTPEQAGRHVFLVEAGRGSRGTRPYRLTVSRAGGDDTAPGTFVRNYQRVSGALSGSGIDVVDLYRFDVRRRSDLKLRLRTQGRLTMRLLSETGGQLACACQATGDATLERRVRTGRYFVAVTASGTSTARYSFVRITRSITATAVTINGGRVTRTPPGREARIAVHIRPGVSGPVTTTVERFDPLIGWQFAFRYQTTASDGRTSIPFLPPSEGLWRARAVFTGTRDASESESGYARLRVAGPLEE